MFKINDIVIMISPYYTSHLVKDKPGIIKDIDKDRLIVDFEGHIVHMSPGSARLASKIEYLLYKFKIFYV